MGSSFGQRFRQRPRAGRQETGYAAPGGYDAPDAQPAYGDDQDVYEVSYITDNTIQMTCCHTNPPNVQFKSLKSSGIIVFPQPHLNHVEY